MIAEIVSNGMLSLPNAMAAVGSFSDDYLSTASCRAYTRCLGLVPAVILTVFLGIFGLFTAKLLIDFKLNHPGVHNMGKFHPLLTTLPPLTYFLLQVTRVIFYSDRWGGRYFPLVPSFLLYLQR